MAVPKTTTWSIDEHTMAKHAILRRYLEAWFPILSSWNGRIIYLDGFCGPGRYDGGEPGSPIIALEVAKNHRSKINGEIVFWFIDEDERRIQNLKGEIAKENWPKHFQIKDPEKGLFHERFSAVLDKLEKDKKVLAPTFAFIDPFGFSGVPFALIKRLLGNPNCEVLITFMVDAINRFLEQKDVSRLIVELLGTAEAASIVGQMGIDRMAKLRELYQEQLQKVAQAKYVRVFRMKNAQNRPIYDLFFATNNPVGHKKMKEAMWRVDAVGGNQFSDATNPAQLFLLDPQKEVYNELVNIILREFEGKKASGKEVADFVMDCTGFLNRHKTAALRHIEDAMKKIVNVG